MGILVPFIWVLPHSAGTGSPVSSPVLCMVGTCTEMYRKCTEKMYRKCDVKNKTFFQKLFITE